MKWYVGVDGGGTKTAFVAAQADGTPLATLRKGGCSHQSIGIEAAATLLAEGVRECLAKAGGTLETCGGCCMGVPCFGENDEADARLLAALQKALAPVPVRLMNDVEAAFAGAQENGAGIHLVAGTGSIAFGRDAQGRTARSGGWNEFFGDEGSCYWVGRAAMSAFSKEADGRLPKGALYRTVRQALSLADDFAFVPLVTQTLAPHRARVADFQRHALCAAEAGDPAAVALYTAAAQELALLACAVKAQLAFPAGEPVSVTYTGGLFCAGALVLRPLEAALAPLGCRLCAPQRDAAQGALRLAIAAFHQETEE